MKLSFSGVLLCSIVCASEYRMEWIQRIWRSGLLLASSGLGRSSINLTVWEWAFRSTFRTPMMTLYRTLLALKCCGIAIANLKQFRSLYSPCWGRFALMSCRCWCRLYLSLQRVRSYHQQGAIWRTNRAGTHRHLSFLSTKRIPLNCRSKYSGSGDHWLPRSTPSSSRRLRGPSRVQWMASI